jgi:hypothetical protein
VTIRNVTRVMPRPNEANQISIMVDMQSSANETGREGRTKRCLYLLESCSVDDPYS